MAVEATFTKYKRNNFLTGIVILIVAALYFAYDGHFNEKFQEKYTNVDGSPDSTLVFNRKSPPYLLAGAVVLAGWLWMIKGRKIVAGDEGLVFNDDEKVAYDMIQSVNKTNFKSKGYFVLTYKDDKGKEVDRKISDRSYDNLEAVLDEIVAKIS